MRAVPSPAGRGWPEGPGEGRRASGYASGSRRSAPTLAPKRRDPHPPLRGCPLPVGEGTEWAAWVVIMTAYNT